MNQWDGRGCMVRMTDLARSGDERRCSERITEWVPLREGISSWTMVSDSSCAAHWDHDSASLLLSMCGVSTSGTCEWDTEHLTQGNRNKITWRRTAQSVRANTVACAVKWSQPIWHENMPGLCVKDSLSESWAEFEKAPIAYQSIRMSQHYGQWLTLGVSQCFP